VRIRSTGTAAFSVKAIEVDGAFFHHDGACAEKVLAPDDECELGVSYTPTSGDEPRQATLIIHQTLSGDPTRVQLKGTGPAVTPTIDVPRPTVASCQYSTGNSGRLQAELAVSLVATEGSADAPEKVALSAGVDPEDVDVRDAALNGEAVNLVVAIPPEKAVAGLVIEVKADARQEVAESDEDNVTRVTAASMPTAGAACSA
jgi:hypothetical protein